MSDKKVLKPYGEKQMTFDKRYLEMALIWAQNSYCIRRQVGALIVKEKMIISDGYNGTPSGFENVCEDENNVTKPYVLHAEANAITKVAKSNNSSEDSTLYVTTSPCMECSKLIIQAGIKRVVFCNRYHNTDGLDLLKRAGIELVYIDPKKIFMNYNNSKRSIFLPVMLGVALAIGILIGKFLPGEGDLPQHSNIRSRNDKLNSILNIIESNYVDSVNRNDLVETAIPAILKKLDPHSVYIPAKRSARANEPLQGNFEGIGISFNMLTDTILVISTIPGGPSEKLGLLPGDKILYVNDSLVAGRHITDEKVMGMLKGPRGTVVKIKILRGGQKELLTFDITRDKIPIYSIDVYYMVNDYTGYIKVNAFAMTTFDEFMKGLRELKEKGMTSLILDLRGNSGGIMEAAIQIANQFLKEGQLIVYTKGRAQPRSEAKATGKGEFESGDLVVLIDEWSASASEILAGAIQDNDRGTIIGRRSFGKGLVQEPIPFADGSGMRLTIARYYTPTGRSIQKPYKDGFDKYYDDLNDRYIHGEFEVSDSIHFSDSLKFTTPGGRIVYGGGGIMPDKFVPADTSGVSPYFVKIRSLIYRFALKYTENNRELLKKFTESGEMEKFLDKQALLDQFIQFADANGIKKDPAGLKISGYIIQTQVKAYIARNILDNKGFYPIWEDIDTTLKYAIDFLKK